MVELPEALTLTRQLYETIKGKKIANTVAAHSPHKFAWYQGDPGSYQSLLKNKIITNTAAVGGAVEIQAEGVMIVLSEGIGLRYHTDAAQLPKKHQLMIEFEDSSFLSVSIQMYGGILSFVEGTCDNEYYLAARGKPSPYGDTFDEPYFNTLISAPGLEEKSIKFVLATEQRIPGFGNGVLQDVLFAAKVHPRRKTASLSDSEKNALFHSLKSVLREMAEKGGRDTEKDLFGNPGGYQTKMSKNTVGKPCPVCRNPVTKESYLGGSVYVCSQCQKQ